MKKILLFSGLLAVAASAVSADGIAQNKEEPKPQEMRPGLRHVLDIRAEIAAPLDAGRVPHGKRVVIPITGGTVTGEITGRILPGGADYQLVDTVNNRTELKAVYTIMADDATLINVTNEGVISTGTISGNDNGNNNDNGGYYFMTSPKFECDLGSSYAWLNNRVFVCRPVKFENGAIVLRVWAAE